MFGPNMSVHSIPTIPHHYFPNYPYPVGNHIHRQQPYPIPPHQSWNIHPHWGQNQHPMELNQLGNQGYLPYQNQQWIANPYQSYGGQQDYGHTIFANPLQPVDNMQQYGQSAYNTNYQNLHQYPKNSLNPRPPSGVKSIMNSFKAQDGTLDLNKMVDTAGQMMNAVSQVSSMVKGFGGIFKA